MTTSEKLIKIAENQIKVYNAGVQKGQETGGYEEGQKAYGQTKTVVGSAVALKRLHPTAHNIEVKLSHPTKTDFSDVVIKRYGKNILPFPFNGHLQNPYEINGLSFLMNNDGSLTINGTATAETYYQFVKPKTHVLTPGNYVLFSCPAGGIKAGRAYTYMGKNTLYKTENNVYSVTSTFTIDYLMYVARPGTYFENYTIRPMLCLVDFGNPYNMYTAPIEYPVPENGVLSIPSNGMLDATLIADNDEITMEATYYLSNNDSLEQFWDDYQENGRRADCGSLFRGPQWASALFQPRHNIMPTKSCSQPFGATSYTGDLVQRLRELDVVLDFSQCPSMVETFYTSKITHLGVIDTSSASSVNNIFAYANELETIDLLVLKEDGSQQFAKNSFINCKKLVNINIRGKIGTLVTTAAQKYLDFSACVNLSTQSMRNIINSLADLTDTTKANQYPILFPAARWEALEAEGGQPEGYNSWQDYVVYGLKWSI